MPRGGWSPRQRAGGARLDRRCLRAVVARNRRRPSSVRIRLPLDTSGLGQPRSSGSHHTVGSGASWVPRIPGRRLVSLSGGVVIERILAVIPARGGSRGLPGKNLKELGGVPLVGHSIAAARTVSQVRRIVVSTDDEQVATVSRSLGADVPFLRPPELATDTAPTGPVVTHALAAAETQGDAPYDAVLLLEPTSPLRDPARLAEAVSLLGGHPAADGAVSVSVPGFDPMSTGVEVDGTGAIR